jgi:hypothetical protein
MGERERLEVLARDFRRLDEPAKDSIRELTRRLAEHPAEAAALVKRGLERCLTRTGGSGGGETGE